MVGLVEVFPGFKIIAEVLVLSSWYLVSGHKIFGKGLGCLHASSSFRWPETPYSGCMTISSTAYYSSQMPSPARKKSPIPATKGASGPGTTKFTLFSLANARRAGKSSGLTWLIFWTFCSPRAVPPFPGTTKISWTNLDCASFHARADSLPPLPTSNIIRGSPAIVHKVKVSQEATRIKRWGSSTRGVVKGDQSDSMAPEKANLDI